MRGSGRDLSDQSVGGIAQGHAVNEADEKILKSRGFWKEAYKEQRRGDPLETEYEGITGVTAQ